MDLQTIFSTNTKAQTVAPKGTAIVSNTMLILNKEDSKGFSKCVYGVNDNTLYIKLTNETEKNEKHSEIRNGKIRLNIAKGLGLTNKANKQSKLEQVKGQANTYSIKLA